MSLTHPILPTKYDTSLMDIGDVISCEYTALSGQVGVFNNLGNATKELIPISGTVTPDGSFFFIKVSPTLLIPDRVLQTNITWDVLNTAEYIKGSKILLEKGTATVVPTMTSPTTPSGIASLSKLALDVTHDAWTVFDKTNSNYAYIASDDVTGEAWIQYEFETPTMIDRCYFTCPWASNGVVTKYKLLACIDNTENWIELYYGENLSQNTNILFTFNNSTSYKKYRLEILESSRVGKVTAIDILELGIKDIFIEDKMIRLLSGGIGYLDECKRVSTTNKELGGYPMDNEWDKYVVNSDLNRRITPGDDNIWHWENTSSLMKDTTIIGFIRTPYTYTVSTNTVRTIRGDVSETSGGLRGIGCVLSNGASVNWGFRPCLQLKHPKQTNLWY